MSSLLKHQLRPHSTHISLRLRLRHIKRCRLPILALLKVQLIVPHCRRIISLSTLFRVPKIHHPAFITRVVLPNNIVFGIRVCVTDEVNDSLLEDFREGGVHRGDEWCGWVVLRWVSFCWVGREGERGTYCVAYVVAVHSRQGVEGISVDLIAGARLFVGQEGFGEVLGVTLDCEVLCY